MTDEIVTIKVIRYRSPDGEPTCCADAQAGRICAYLGTRSFGQMDVCMLGQHRDIQRPKAVSYTRPLSDCPVWENPLIRGVGQTETLPENVSTCNAIFD